MTVIILNVHKIFNLFNTYLYDRAKLIFDLLKFTSLGKTYRKFDIKTLRKQILNFVRDSKVGLVKPNLTKYQNIFIIYSRERSKF